MNNFKALMASSDQPESLGYALRNKRFQVFEDLINKNFPADQTIHILDVGGTAYFWEDKNMVLEGRIKVTLLNLEQEYNLPFGIDSMSGDATDLSQFDDNEFDLVFSNSVIEHLYTWKNQKKMARECMRVGKRFFIQTPNKHFPVEAHYAIPLIQYAPKKLAFMVLTKTKISRMRKWKEKDAQQYLDEIRLINESEMEKLFPEANIYKEKWLGMTKSFTAHNL
ncbi:class I SAM-dependent methyltransferase [Mongoliibacter ruber]|uniref:Methyltransferase family protein n=1 Tax=Mongoliibacter ruber TaxID=1750599 RepID=A0A2T0WT46_9BACT|nr:class I SAM-dependent methyltransferase [Mongoliibacter ruber]PRY89871.1 methyltransferase family protein [Mongoliibacter ruber]